MRNWECFSPDVDLEWVLNEGDLKDKAGIYRLKNLRLVAMIEAATPELAVLRFLERFYIMAGEYDQDSPVRVYVLLDGDRFGHFDIEISLSFNMIKGKGELNGGK